METVRTKDGLAPAVLTARPKPRVSPSRACGLENRLWMRQRPSGEAAERANEIKALRRSW